jgi:hypothetical protein
MLLKFRDKAMEFLWLVVFEIAPELLSTGTTPL